LEPLGGAASELAEVVVSATMPNSKNNERAGDREMVIVYFLVLFF
jgi:hypothetical protein